MRHRVKKARFKGGRDAVRSFSRKLAVNFIRRGRLEITHKRAKSLKSQIDRLVSKAKDDNEARRRLVFKRLADRAAVKQLFEVIAPKMSGRVGGFVNLKKIGPRRGDGAPMTRVQWIESEDKIKAET